MLNAFVGGWEMAGMWLFNTGRPWGLPQNVIYDGNAKIDDVDYNDPRVIRAVRTCVAQMNDAGVVGPHAELFGCGGLHRAQLHHQAELHGRVRAVPRLRDYAAAVLPVRHELREVVPVQRTRCGCRFGLEIYNILNQVIYDERQYENNATNALFGTIDKSVIRQSNFPRYGQLGH